LHPFFLVFPSLITPEYGRNLPIYRPLRYI
jgi:hypothetical protein